MLEPQAPQPNLRNTEAQEPPLKIVTMAALARAKKPPMLIEGVLGQRAIHLWTGMPYAGKTFLAIEAMRAVAEAPTSTPFLRHFRVPRPGNVLYLGNDSPDWDVREQVDKIVGLPLPENIDEAVERTSAGAYGFIFDQSFALATAADAQRLVDAAKRFSSTRAAYADSHDTIRGVALIVVDTLRSVHGFEENSNTEMQHVVNLLRYIANQTGAAVIGLHHFNKAHPGERNAITLERVRGAVAIAGGVDSVLALGTGKEGTQAVHVLKHRVAPKQGNFMYNMLDTGPSSMVLSFHSEGVGNPEVLEIVGKMVAEAEGWVRTSDLVARVKEQVKGIDSKERRAENAVGAALRSLEKAGVVVRVHGAARRAAK